VPLAEIRYARVEEYIAEKLREKPKPLSPRTINMTVSLLARILESALEDGLIDRNPTTGSRRRVPAGPSRRAYIETADRIAALLQGARQADEAARSRKGQRHALLATLVFAGLRIGEALALHWDDVDLANKRLQVRASKTPTGIRAVRMLPVLHDYRSVTMLALEALAFGTNSGEQHSQTNVRQRILAPAVVNANAILAAAGRPPLPEGLTPHGLRRTFASLLWAIGKPQPYTMRALGHASANLTVEVYSGDLSDDADALRALVGGTEPMVDAVNAEQPTPF
jgi:integrase